MAYANAKDRIQVKDAVNAVRAFISELYGPDRLRFVELEEVEFTDNPPAWRVTMGFSNATLSLVNPSERELRVFTVDAQTGEVTAMKLRDSH